MPDRDIRLALRQADQASTDFAILETEIEAIHARLARMPTRADLARAALGIIFCTALIEQVLGFLFR
jgi:ABC-type transport system involved in cytochrome c biogenesis permease component